MNRTKRVIESVEKDSPSGLEKSISKNLAEVFQEIYENPEYIEDEPFENNKIECISNFNKLERYIILFSISFGRNMGNPNSNTIWINILQDKSSNKFKGGYLKKENAKRDSGEMDEIITYKFKKNIFQFFNKLDKVKVFKGKDFQNILKKFKENLLFIFYNINKFERKPLPNLPNFNKRKQYFIKNSVIFGMIWILDFPVVDGIFNDNTLERVRSNVLSSEYREIDSEGEMRYNQKIIPVDSKRPV